MSRSHDVSVGALLASILVPVLAVSLLFAATPLVAQSHDAESRDERASHAGTVAVRGDVVHTMSGDADGDRLGTLEDGVVLVEDGKITAVGPAGEVVVPEGVRVVRAAVVVPGLVDARSVVGFAGYLNQDSDQDQLERSSPVQPELRAVDAYNPRERLVEWVRDFGVTTLHTGHGPGAVISGETMIVKTRGETVDDAVVVPAAMIAATLGEGAADGDDGKGWPGTRAKAAALLRSELLAARQYVDAQDKAAGDEDAEPPARDLAKESLARVIRGEMPLLVRAQRHQDLMTALRIAEEFAIDVVLEGAAEAYTLTEEIRAAGVQVIVHPTMKRAVGETENLTMENAARLADAGIPIALESGFEAYVPKTRVVLFEAGVAAAYGLGFERALTAVTIDAARILGIVDRVGSLEVGKDGDLALYDGDPFEYTTHNVGVVIDGVVMRSEDDAGEEAAAEEAALEEDGDAPR